MYLNLYNRFEQEPRSLKVIGRIKLYVFVNVMKNIAAYSSEKIVAKEHALLTISFSEAVVKPLRLSRECSSEEVIDLASTPDSYKVEVRRRLVFCRIAGETRLTNIDSQGTTLI